MSTTELPAGVFARAVQRFGLRRFYSQSSARREFSAKSYCSRNAGRFLSWSLLFAFVPLFLPAHVSAQEEANCETAVIDTSGQLDVATVDAVVRAEAAKAQGEQIYVRVYGDLPSGELAAKRASFRDACGSSGWISILVSVDGREMELDAAVVDSEQLDQVSKGIMSPRFAADDFTSGVVNGLQEINSLQIAALPDAGSTDSNSTGSDSTDSDSADSDSTGSGLGAGGAGVATALALGGGGAAVLAASVGGVVFARRRTLDNARQLLGRKLADPQVRAGASQQRYTQLLNQVDVWRRLSAGQTLRKLDVKHQAADKTSRRVQENFTLMNKALQNGLADATSEELERADQYLAKLVTALDQQDVTLDALLNLGARIDHLRVTIPAKQGLLLEEIESAKRLAAEIGSRNSLEDQPDSPEWDVTMEIMALGEIVKGLDGLKLNALALDVFSLHKTQEDLEAKLFATAHRLQSLPDRLASLKKWRSQLDLTHDMEVRRADEVGRRFAELPGVHSRASWKWAEGYPEKALDQLTLAMTLLRTINVEALSSAELDGLGGSLEAAGLELLVADDLLDQVDELLVDLDRARLESQGIIDQSKKVVKALHEYVDGHADDLTLKMQEAPGLLLETVSKLEQELGLARPNYLRVAQTGDRLNREADNLLIEAQDQQQKTEAIRREGDREIARAQRSLQRARAAVGWQLLESSDTAALDKLAQRLSNVPTDPVARLEAASKIADAAVAIRERIIARRRRNAGWVVLSGGSSWSGGGWSSDSGWSGGGGSAGGGSFGGSVGGGSFGGSMGGGSFGGGHSSSSW